MINELQPVFEPADRPTGYCTATVRGGRLVGCPVDIPGGLFGTENPQIAECASGALPLGVACYDGATGDNIPLLRVGIVPLVAGVVNIAVNTALMSDGQGRVIPWTTGNHRIGLAVSASVSVGDVIGVALTIS